MVLALVAPSGLWPGLAEAQPAGATQDSRGPGGAEVGAPPGATGSTSPPVQATRQLRRGLSLEVAWGLGRGFHRYQGADSAPVGIGTSFGVGWYLRPRLALAWRFGVLAMAGVDVDRVTEMHYTGAAQYWLADKVWLGAAVGVGGIGNDDRGEDQIVWGPALEGRAGWVVNDSKHSVALILGATAAMVEDERLLGVVMHIGYQLQ